MNMNPYFTAINYPLEKQSLMLMALPDFQSARYGNNYFTGMVMAEYGITPRWTVAVMAEGQKIAGLPVTYGGMRYGTYFHLFGDDRFLNLTLYGEYEDLNGAALYKMEVSGFGTEDLTEPLALARDTRVRTFEQRVILYHDWDRLNATFNFIRETPLQAPYGSDYGYALGLFFKPSWMGGSMGDMTEPAAFSMSRLGYGLEMIGALGDNGGLGSTGTPSSNTLALFSPTPYLPAGRCVLSLRLDSPVSAIHSCCAWGWRTCSGFPLLKRWRRGMNSFKSTKGYTLVPAHCRSIDIGNVHAGLSQSQRRM